VKLKLSLIVALFFNVHFVSAQSPRLNVIFSTDKNDLLVNATAVLYHLPDSTLVASKVISQEGYFDVASRTSYLLQVTATGKKTSSHTIRIEDTSVTIRISLHNSVKDLAVVTVVSKKPLIQQEDDKTIVDATALAASSTSAYEVLEKTPGLVVDQDGNVYVSSTAPATIYINGKEMKLGSNDLASLLKSLPANSVSKIELLPNPSAKYDASSSGGIVNIVLKKGVKLGTSGSVNIAYFQGVYGTKTGGINMNKGSGTVTSYFSYQYTNRNNFETLSSGRRITADSSLVAQESRTTYPSTTHYTAAGINWNFSKNWTAGYDLRLSATKNNSHAYNNIDITNYETGLLTGKNASDINNNNRSTYIGNTFSAKYKIDSLGSEWNTTIDYTYFKYNNQQFYFNSLFLPVKPGVTGDGLSNNRKNIVVLQSDLTWKLPKKYTLEAGFKSTISNSRNSADYFIDTGSNIRLVDPFQTNTFTYRESIGAGYVQVAKTFAGFTIKPGLRAEITDIEGRQRIPKDTVFWIKRTDLFPYVFLKHKLFRIFGFPLIGNVIYRKSIKRPYYETLNPYPKYIDQYLYEKGNPGLKPQFTTNYELNVTFNDIPVFALGINNTKDIFSNVTYQDSITKIALRTYDNLGKNKEFYFKLIGGIPPGGKYFFYAGVQYNYNQYRGLYQGRPLDYNRGSYTFFMYHEFRATKKVTFNMQAFMKTKGLQNLYELDDFGGMYVSVNRAVFHKKGNIILSVSDLLRTNRVSFKLRQADIDASGTRYNDTRKLGLTFRYNFGFKPKEEKKNLFDAPAEGN
jgi:hypothetical protein